MARLLLVRHGITEHNSARRFAGFTDIELSEAGYRQAERLRDRLVNERIDAVYSSDLKRARVTAEVIADGREMDIVTCPELREMNYGVAEGLTFQEISDLHPEVAEHISNFDLKLKFPDGESFEGLIERTVNFLEKINDHDPEHTVLIASHNGPLRVLVCHLLGIDQNHWRQIRIDNASLSIVGIYPRGVIINLLNDISHLSGDD